MLRAVGEKIAILNIEKSAIGWDLDELEEIVKTTPVDDVNAER